MVECELKPYGMVNVPESVLIDTWWNVNFVDIFKLTNQFRVLIDTWWNVNCSYRMQGALRAIVLIDTWWNVN